MSQRHILNIDQLVNRVSAGSVALWVFSLVAPMDGGAQGVHLALLAAVSGMEGLKVGSWAALANLTIPWAGLRLYTGNRAPVAVTFSLVLPLTSSAFWEILGKSKINAPAVYLWTASIAMVVLASILASFMNSNTEPRPSALPSVPTQTSPGFGNGNGNDHRIPE